MVEKVKVSKKIIIKNPMDCFACCCKASYKNFYARVSPVGALRDLLENLDSRQSAQMLLPIVYDLFSFWGYI